MGKTSIEWTRGDDGTSGETWNPVRGCTKVSPGCKHCYAETFAERWRGVPGHPYEQGFDLRLVPEKLAEPLHWKKPRRVFVNSMSDLFHEDVPEDFIRAVYTTMAATPQHTCQVLTKRADRRREILARWKAERLTLRDGCGSVLPNVWEGVSVENQQYADERIPELLATPAAVRFVSAEPLLGPIDIDPWLREVIPIVDMSEQTRQLPLDWVIVGGESGPGARPFNLKWADDILRQCREAGVAAFFKQAGARPYFCAGHDCPPACNCGGNHDCNGRGFHCGIKLRSRKGSDMDELPSRLRVRQWPERTAEG